MRTLAHISDLHFGTETPHVVDALAAEIARLWPDLVVVSGDLTQRATEEEFRAARAFLTGLHRPVLAVPGNHDIPLYDLARRAFSPFGRFRRFIEPTPAPTWSDEEVAVIGLNTARPVRWKEGHVNFAQIRAARRWMCSTPAPTKILVTHHPFLPPEYAPHAAVVGRSTEALASLSTCGVDVVLSGHLHRAYSGDAGAHHLVLHRAVLVAQAGSAVSHRVRGEPNGYNIVRVHGPDVEVELRRFERGAFVTTSRLRYVRHGGAWSAS